MEDISINLAVLRNPRASLQEREKAFKTLRQQFSPSIHETNEYAAEIRRVFDLRFGLWPKPPSPPPNDPLLIADRIRGVVFGSALGDSMGLATEFLTKAQVLDYYGSSHVFQPLCEVYPDYHRLAFPIADWTDDTDQLILILQTLLENKGEYNGPSFAKKLTKWVKQGFMELGDSGGSGLGRTTKTVVRHHLFEDQPHQAAHNVWLQSGKQAAPNGAVMRTAITAVPFYWDADRVQQNTMDFCRATHADPRCIASTVVIAECVRQLISSTENDDSLLQVEDIIQSSISRSESILESDKDKEELLTFASVCDIEELTLDDPTGIGYTFRCMGAGLWALRTSEREKNIQSILQELVAQGGDADTNSAVAGALLGARFGYSRLPKCVTDLPYMVWLESWVQKVLYMMDLPIKMNCSGFPVASQEE